jgi:ubiquinone/menaquinone biosynthesis C-methylase UbiE
MKSIISSHHKRQIQFFSNEYSQFGDYQLVPWQKFNVDRILSSVNTLPSKTRVLDIASGSGYAAVEFSKKGFSVTATDLTPGSIKLLDKYKKDMKLKNLKLLLCRAEKIPLPKASFDVIIANAILEHIPEEKQAIREWCRLLRSGGILAVTVPLKLKYIWPPLWYANHKHDKEIGHLRRYDLSDLRTKFPLRLEKVFYTGNILKITGLIVNYFLKSQRVELLFEKLDQLTVFFPYGANNIMVIFRK